LIYNAPKKQRASEARADSRLQICYEYEKFELWLKTN